MTDDGRQGLEDLHARRFAAEDERTSAELTARWKASIASAAPIAKTGRFCPCGMQLGWINRSGECSRCSNRRRSRERPSPSKRQKKAPPFTTDGEP